MQKGTALSGGLDAEPLYATNMNFKINQSHKSTLTKSLDQAANQPIQSNKIISSIMQQNILSLEMFQSQLAKKNIPQQSSTTQLLKEDKKAKSLCPAAFYNIKKYQAQRKRDPKNCLKLTENINQQYYANSVNQGI